MSLATFPHAFCKSTQHGVGRACQILHSAVPQPNPNSNGDAIPPLKSLPLGVGVNATSSSLCCTLLYVPFVHILTSQATVSDKSKT